MVTDNREKTMKKKVEKHTIESNFAGRVDWDFRWQEVFKWLIRNKLRFHMPLFTHALYFTDYFHHDFIFLSFRLRVKSLRWSIIP